MLTKRIEGDNCFPEGSIILRNEYISHSHRQTVQMGKRIGAQLKGGDVVALCGTLGAGKTAFSRGLADGLAVNRSLPVTSPTYTIVNQYEGRFPVHHIDYYRLRSEDEFYLSGLEECFASDAVTIIEWADRFPNTLPPDALWIHIDLLDLKKRCIKILYAGNNHERFNL